MISPDTHGHVFLDEVPDWGPLLSLAPDCVDDFMWMFEVECDGGTRIHAYKHRWTRCYLHLSSDGRAFVYSGCGSYREVAPLELLRQVLA